VVAAILETVESTSQYRTNSLFSQKAPYRAPSDIPGLDNIVEIDLDTCTAWVEPNVTMEELVQATVIYGLIPAVVAASRKVSVANAFAATTTESSSFKFGTFDCAVLSLENVLSNGQYVMARTTDRNTTDLLFGSAGAMHSLGLTTLLEIALIPASEYVEVTYWPVFSVSGIMRKIRQEGQDPSMLKTSVVNDSTDFVESCMFDAFSGVVITGRFISSADHISIPPTPDGQDFVNHARSVWNATRYDCQQRVDVFHTMKYLFRYDDHRTISVQKQRGFNRQDRANRIEQTRNMMLQDIGMPPNAAAKHIHNFHEAQDIWPIWIHPVKPPSAFGRRSFGIGAAVEQDFWNVRFYSPSATCDGVMERRLRDAHGFRYLHCRAPCNDDTAWVFHDDRWYSELRSRWNAQGFPDISTRLGTSHPLI
jgi:hypothetical protein